MAMNIRVATVDGRPLSQQVLLRRSAAYPGVFVPIGHDRFAGTVVIKAP